MLIHSIEAARFLFDLSEKEPQAGQTEVVEHKSQQHFYTVLSFFLLYITEPQTESDWVVCPETDD